MCECNANSVLRIPGLCNVIAKEQQEGKCKMISSMCKQLHINMYQVEYPVKGAGSQRNSTNGSVSVGNNMKLSTQVFLVYTYCFSVT